MSDNSFTKLVKVMEKEKTYKYRKTLLDGVPKTLPALLKAQKISRRAASAGFDWPDVEFAVNKVHEELEEVKEEIKSKIKRSTNAVLRNSTASGVLTDKQRRFSLKTQPSVLFSPFLRL